MSRVMPALLLGLALGAAAAGAATPPARVLDLDGHPVDPLHASAAVKASVFLFTSTDCPVANRYAPEVKRLFDRYSPQGVRFWLVYPNPADTPDLIRAHVKAFAYPGDILRDPTQALAAFAHATVTPEAAVYAGGRVVYHGRIDDRFVDFGRERPEATEHDLGDALAAVVAGRPAPKSFAQPIGCFIADFAR